ncbi:MAG: NYN domain-containing protein [Thermodesulfobacteriota bacterium]
MHLIIDGYNLLHVGRSLIKLSPIELQWERDRLIDQLSKYQQIKPWKITVVFDGWQGGWSTEKRDKKKGIELIFSKLGEKADDVIKRLVREKGSGAMVVTSDREVSKYAERMAVAVIPSGQFKKKIARTLVNGSEEDFEQEEGEKGLKRKGPSRRLSKKERRIRTALKKL